MQIRLTIYGSCVTRDIVRVTEGRFVLSNYIARQNLISAFSNPVPLPSEWGIESSFQKKSLTGDFKADAINRIRESSAETDVLIWDLGSERHGVFALPDGTFISATPTQRASSGIMNIKGRKLIAFGSKLHLQLFNDAAHRFRDALRSIGLWGRTYVVPFPFTDQIAEGGQIRKKRSAEDLNLAYSPYYDLLKSLGFALLPQLPEDLHFTTTEHIWGPSQNHYIDSAYEWWAGKVEELYSKPPRNSTEEDHRLSGLPIHISTTNRENPTSMVVLMPAALSSKREDRSKRYFTRFRWEEEWPDSEVVSFSDPALQQDKRLNGAWYIHAEFDILKTFAEIVTERADARNIPRSRITFYGSSLGGFGALGAAAHVPGAKAIAEVPQIDVANWSPGAVRSIENYILQQSMEEYRATHPEQISLQDRFEACGRVPELLIITNSGDKCYEEQRNFYKWLKESNLKKDGPVEFLETTRVDGHRVMKREDVVSLIRP